MSVSTAWVEGEYSKETLSKKRVDTVATGWCAKTSERRWVGKEERSKRGLLSLEDNISDMEI